MKKKYEKPTLEVIEMDKELLGLVTASNGDYDAWSKKNNNLLDMETDQEADENEIMKSKYDLWSEE